MRSSIWTRGTTTNVGHPGLAEMLLRLWADRRVAKTEREREMELVEILSLGGRRQLMLIRCAGERFLVGGSLDRIETMVKLESGDPGSARKGSTCE